MYYIINYWLNDELNVIKITNKLKEKYQLEKINNLFIYCFLKYCRIIIANYIRSKYQLDPLAYKDAYQIIDVDEILFTHFEGDPIWIVGLINLTTNEIRLEIVENRTTETLKKIIEKHVLTGNAIAVIAGLPTIFSMKIILGILILNIIIPMDSSAIVAE